ncbi:MAG: ABC transporter permease, partial [Candidatus Auribacterota bacterium]|nr:ABC transporter permease [Candidatus Auribacterota bacterium]
GPYRIKLEDRVNFTTMDATRIALFSVILTLIAFSAFFLKEGINPFVGYREMFSYAFATSAGIELTLRRMSFMLFVTLAFIIPMRGGVCNVGAPGQLYMGMIAAVGIGIWGKGLPPGVLIPLMLVAAIIGGGLLGAFVGYLKEKMNVNEIVVALMINLIMYYLVKYLIEGPWMDRSGRPESAQLPHAARLPMISDSLIPYSIFLAIALGIILYFFLTKTNFGYQIRLMGTNPNAARYSGISRVKIGVVTMFMGGALAAIAGIHQVAGIAGVYRIHRYFAGKPGTWAYYGIVFGLISVLNPMAAIVVCFLFTGMQVGTLALQMRLGMGYGADLAMIGILMIFLVAGQFFYRKKIVFSREINTADGEI